MKHWIELAGISDGFLLRGVRGNRLNPAMDPGQISRVFKSLAVKAKLDPEQISGHSTRIGAAQDLLSGGASIGQIMAKVGWSKVDTVMRYVGLGAAEATLHQKTELGRSNFIQLKKQTLSSKRQYFGTLSNKGKTQNFKK